MDIYSKEKLDELYNINIFQKNKEKILSGGIPDKFLTNAKNDNRISLNLLIRINPEISDKIENCISELKNLEPSLYYYPKSDLHVTVIDILKASPDRSIPENLNEYINCIKKCASQIKPFKIEFNGLTMSDNAIMVKGYYEYELQKFRELLRKTLKESGLSIEERYETISCHITISRVPDKINNPNDLIKFIEKDKMFGVIEIDSFELSLHNWYDTKKEVLSIIKL